MLLRLITDSFTRRPRRKLLTAAALALGMAVATAALSVSLDVGDRLAQEFRSLGANLVVTPEADSLPLEINGVDYRPANSAAYLPESDLPKIKSVYWRNNIIAFAPILTASVVTGRWGEASREIKSDPIESQMIGTWIEHPVTLSDGRTFITGIDKANPWWNFEGKWFEEKKRECIVGSRAAQRLHLKIGDELLVSVDDPMKKVQRFLALKVTGILSSGGTEDEAVLAPLNLVQEISQRPGLYQKLYVSALTKPEDDFARRNPKTMSPQEFERWSCSPYVSSIAYSIQQVLPGSNVRVVRRVAEGEGQILKRVQSLLWLVTAASLLAAALAVGASSAASVIERRSELALMKALGAGSATVGVLLAAEQLLLAFVGGGLGYAIGLILARIVGEKIFGVAPQPSMLVLGVILALAAAITLIGSALPLRRAARTEPAPILRGE